MLKPLLHFLLTPYRAYRSYQDNPVVGDYSGPDAPAPPALGLVDTKAQEADFDSEHKKPADMTAP